MLLVTYARKDTNSNSDVPGIGNGFIAAFDYNGNLLSTLVARGPLNSPWGLTMAASTFGDFANTLLVANSGDGRINAFDATTGAWKGALTDTQGSPIVIPGLRALHFGGGGQAGTALRCTLRLVSEALTVNRWDRTDHESLFLTAFNLQKAIPRYSAAWAI
jgi:uncharacterized protein (TIGR03118 family)